MRSTPSIRCAALAALFAFSPRLVAGGDWHVGKELICSDCHTAHNSAGGAPMRYDLSPAVSSYLLRGADEVSLCLACHDGSNPRAPDVLQPVGYVGNPAGGFFMNRGGTATGMAHDLLLSSPVPVPDGDGEMVLACSSCHEPHGNGNYRNLRERPSGAAGSGTPVVVDQTKRANGNNPAEVYDASNLVYRTAMSLWCQDCHNQIGAGHAASHPSDLQIYGAASASYDTWAAVSAARVPVQNPTDPAIPSQDDQVFCLSCHSAHGSGNLSLLRFADGLSIDSTCNQCHTQ